MAGKRYWLMKSEPDAYGWDDLVETGQGDWDGVRNHQAANNMKAMKTGDEAFFYHSRTGLEIVGIMKVIAAAEPDKSDESGKWVAVRVAPVRPLDRPVTLKEIKADEALSDMVLVRNSRLSVQPVEAAEWDRVLKLSRK